jgi:DNA topoisomerase-1
MHHRPITPIDSAHAAHLRYVYDTRPGIRRIRCGRSFRYVGPDNKPVRDPETLARIRSIVIPPAWTHVWICPLANGHLQATGRDARNRKQSRYHPRWRETRDEAKYERMLDFGRALPILRRHVDHDLSLPGLPREKVLATIVRLMETTCIRVGNQEYARTNGSFGLTTLRTRHVSVTGARIIFNFKGKSGVQHNIDLHDRRLARIVAACRDTPGYELFTYLDNDGAPHTIDASDVNDYLASITSPHFASTHFTAKDFRTWSGTVLACELLCNSPCSATAPPTRKQLQADIVAAIRSVAAQLGNTPTVCRKCYVHPAILESYLNGFFPEAFAQLRRYKPHPGLKPEESTLLHLLEHKLRAAA